MKARRARTGRNVVLPDWTIWPARRQTGSCQPRSGSRRGLWPAAGKARIEMILFLVKTREPFDPSALRSHKKSTKLSVDQPPAPPLKACASPLRTGARRSQAAAPHPHREARLCPVSVFASRISLLNGQRGVCCLVGTGQHFAQSKYPLFLRRAAWEPLLLLLDSALYRPAHSLPVPCILPTLLLSAKPQCCLIQLGPKYIWYNTTGDWCQWTRDLDFESLICKFERLK